MLELIKTCTPLIQSMVWPACVLYMLLRFGKQIAQFFENLSEFKVKAAGIEASATREQIKAAALLGAASQKNPSESGTGVDTTDIANAVSAFSTSRPKASDPARILWVDDRPANNVYEREALEQMGIVFDIALSTEEAIAKLSASHFDLIISDMGRPPDSRAGYTLLDHLRKAGNRIPFVIYAASRAPEHRREAIEHGAIGCTNRPDELFVLVSQGLVVASR